MVIQHHQYSIVFQMKEKHDGDHLGNRFHRTLTVCTGTNKLNEHNKSKYHCRGGGRVTYSWWSQRLVECDDGSTSSIKDSVVPGINVPDQTGCGDAVNISIDTQISFAIKVEIIQRDKDGGCLEKFDRIK
jgi:hypothetical protein